MKENPLKNSLWDQKLSGKLSQNDPQENITYSWSRHN